MAYVSVAVEVDQAAITQEKIDTLQAAIPGLVIPAASGFYYVLDVTSERDAINAQLITQVTDLIWDTFGAQIIRIPRNVATQATGETTWTRTDTTGDLLIPAGTGLSLAAIDGSRVPFVTRNDVTIAAGDLSTGIGEVTIIASSGGADGTGLQTDPQPDETLTWLDAIVVEFPTAGGADDEDLDTYRGRLGDEASLMARTLVLPEDFATRARGITGVDLALALDLYNATTSTTGVAGHMTVAVRDSNGADPGSSVRANVLAALEADSVSILTNHVIAPTFTTLTVAFTGVAVAGYDPADVEARSEQAILDFVNPANWGIPLTAGQRTWVEKPIVRYQDLVTVLNSVDGFDHYTALTLNGGTADVTMTGPAALPAANSTATGTVT